MINNNTMNNCLKQNPDNSTEYTNICQSEYSAIDYYSMLSDISEIYYSNSEESEVLSSPQNINYLHNLSLIDPNFENNCNVIHFKSPLASSSPLKKHKVITEDHYCTKGFKNLSKSNLLHSKCHTPNLLVKPYCNVLPTTLNITKSLSNLKNVTNSLNTKQFPVILQKPSFTSTISDNEIIRLNSLSDVLYSNINKTKNIKEQLNTYDKVNILDIQNNITKNTIKNYLHNTNITMDSCNNNSENIYNVNIINNTCNGKYVSEPDLSEFFQMELSLKMFPGNIVPHLNRLKHEILQFMNNCKYEPNKHIFKAFNNTNHVIKHIHNIMKLNMNSFVNTKSYKTNLTTIQFETINFENLNVFDDKLNHIINILISSKSSLKDFIFKEQSENNCPVEFVGNLPTIETIIESENNVLSDSFDHIRELGKSITLQPPKSNSNVFNLSPQKTSFVNCSLNYEVELTNKEVLDIITPNTDLSFKELNNGAPMSSTINSNSSNLHVKNYGNNQTEKNQNRYCLRNRPKSTDHYFAPFKPSVKRKSRRIKKNCNDVFICKGKGEKRVILQYKFHSLSKSNSNEIMKKINPESNNFSFCDISTLKTRKNNHPCMCGILPSQVPSSWNDSLHKSMHQNLYKLQFKIQTTLNVVGKINNNGFLYNIIKITESCHDDKNLQLALKNVLDFINLEVDFPKKYRLNHSIFLAISPNSKIIGYLEVELLKNACIYQNNQFSDNLIRVKFGVSKLWVMVKYRNGGVATSLLKQFCDDENINTNDIAFSYHGNRGISFIKKYYANKSILIY